MDGKADLEEIKKKYTDLKVIILTVHQHDSFIVNMMELGANGYLLKDTSPTEVFNAIHVVMEEGFISIPGSVRHC